VAPNHDDNGEKEKHGLLPSGTISRDIGVSAYAVGRNGSFPRDTRRLMELTSVCLSCRKGERMCDQATRGCWCPYTCPGGRV
jgi:hypothetical protein